MMGALSASYVTLTTALKFKIAGTEIILQDILDSIAPGILPLLVVFGIYYILKNKSQKYGRISLGIVLICILGAFIGLFQQIEIKCAQGKEKDKDIINGRNIK